ncbi:uncharacterized protein LOC128960821 [Oppia nitens]|uniref:uncharacterized protein LOC128960821 n=1 Tax=Oppia nitens TaxID=1686743 RepID=UPI0023DAA368|nr:uncharacterized protein LOC128960821 [Oppia nitens]
MKMKRLVLIVIICYQLYNLINGLRETTLDYHELYTNCNNPNVYRISRTESATRQSSCQQLNPSVPTLRDYNLTDNTGIQSKIVITFNQYNDYTTNDKTVKILAYFGHVSEGSEQYMDAWVLLVRKYDNLDYWQQCSQEPGLINMFTIENYIYFYRQKFGGSILNCTGPNTENLIHYRPGLLSD